MPRCRDYLGLLLPEILGYRDRPWAPHLVGIWALPDARTNLARVVSDSSTEEIVNTQYDFLVRKTRERGEERKSRRDEIRGTRMYGKSAWTTLFNLFVLRTPL